MLVVVVITTVTAIPAAATITTKNYYLQHYYCYSTSKVKTCKEGRNSTSWSIFKDSKQIKPDLIYRYAPIRRGKVLWRKTHLDSSSLLLHSLYSYHTCKKP